MNTIGIIGLGYVGLPLLLRYAEVGYKTIGFDIDPEKITRFNAKDSYIKHISSEGIAKAIESRAEVTTDFTRISEVDAIIICVPTPLNKYREPDLSYILSTLETTLPYIRKGQVMSLESTTYPGTTEEEIVPRIEEKGFVVGEDYFVVFSPEREDPGNPDFTTATIPKVVGGHTIKCLEKGIELYSKVINRVVPVSSTKVAEMTKLLENIHRSINIGLINEMKMIAEKMDIDIFEVIDAASTKPFGFTPYYPGPGLGGHCIPIDPFYLTWKAKEYGLHTHFIELSGEINRNMPHWVASKITHGLNINKKSVNGSKILVVGIAYKKNIDDMRESPSVAVMEILRDLGADVHYHDEYVQHFPKMREHHFDLSNTKLDAETIAGFDCVALLTDHDYIDYDALLLHSQLLVDTRGKYRKITLDKLIRA